MNNVHYMPVLEICQVMAAQFFEFFVRAGARAYWQIPK